jgi:hypothetical protein
VKVAERFKVKIMRRARILSINSLISGVSEISEDTDPARLPVDATSYTVERGKDGRARSVHPPAVTVINEVVAGPSGTCPQCWRVPGAKALRESEDFRHRLYRCEKCGIDFAVTT